MLVYFKDGSKKTLGLDNYLSIPKPRTEETELAVQMLASQYGIDPASVLGVDFFAGRAGYDPNIAPRRRKSR